MSQPPEEKVKRFQKRLTKFTLAFDKVVAKLEKFFCQYCMEHLMRYSFAVYLTFFNKQVRDGLGTQPVYCPRTGIEQVPIPFDGLHFCINRVPLSHEAIYQFLRFYTHIHFRVHNVNAVSGLLEQYIHNYTIRTHRIPQTSHKPH